MLPELSCPLKDTLTPHALFRLSIQTSLCYFWVLSGILLYAPNKKKWLVVSLIIKRESNVLSNNFLVDFIRLVCANFSIRLFNLNTNIFLQN